MSAHGFTATPAPPPASRAAIAVAAVLEQHGIAATPNAPDGLVAQLLELIRAAERKGFMDAELMYRGQLLEDDRD